MWGPELIGLALGNFLFGVEICQFVFYLQTFPDDNTHTKLLVYVVGALDTTHFVCVTAGFYQVSVTCHINTSVACARHVPSTVVMAILLVYCVAFTVQLFYAHRVWIISGRNRLLASTVVITTTLQLGFGIAVTVEILKTLTPEALGSSKYAPMAAVISAVCDAVITISVAYYLRPTNIRRNNFVKQLVQVFIHMGLFTLLNALAVAILYYLQDHHFGQYLAAAPAIVLSRSYVNSMLAVLNARKPIRDQQENAEVWSIQLATITNPNPC